MSGHEDSSLRAAGAPAGRLAAGAGRPGIGRLRAHTFGVIAMILVQFGLGMGANLFTALPSSDRHRSLFSAFGAAVSDGPVVVSLHALLGTAILVTGAGATVRALRIQRPALVVLTTLALLALLDAWLSGARFVGSGRNGDSFSMAIGAGVALLCYALVLFLSGPRPREVEVA